MKTTISQLYSEKLENKIKDLKKEVRKIKNDLKKTVIEYQVFYHNCDLSFPILDNVYDDLNNILHRIEKVVKND